MMKTDWSKEIIHFRGKQIVDLFKARREVNACSVMGITNVERHDNVERGAF